MPLSPEPAAAARRSIVAPETVEKARKVDAARAGPTRPRAPRAARSRRSPRRYADAHRRIVVANSDGLLADDDQVRTRMMVQCVATGDTGMQTGYEAPGRTMGFELFDAVRTRGGRPHRGDAAR